MPEEDDVFVGEKRAFFRSNPTRIKHIKLLELHTRPTNLELLASKFVKIRNIKNKKYIPFGSTAYFITPSGKVEYYGYLPNRGTLKIIDGEVLTRAYNEEGLLTYPSVENFCNLRL